MRARSGIRASNVSHPRGVALVIALILLLLMTVLAIGAMARSTTELLMAANEQYRRKASQAASAAIEDAVAHIPTATPGTATVQSRGPTPLAEGSFERFSSTTSFAGVEQTLPSSSAGKFAALHYTISGIGFSARGAHDEQTQGVAVIVSADSVVELTRTGPGLP